MFSVDQQSVKSLAKAARAIFGTDAKHMRVLKVICAALGHNPDALLNKLNQAAIEGRDPEIAVPRAFVARFAEGLSAEYRMKITEADVARLIPGIERHG